MSSFDGSVASTARAPDPASDEHSHNLTEATLAFGQLAFEYHSVLCTLAQAEPGIVQTGRDASSAFADRHVIGGPRDIRGGTFGGADPGWIKAAYFCASRSLGLGF